MNKLIAVFAIIASTLLIYACSTTPHQVEKETPVSNWNGKPYKNLLIIGVYEDRPFRISSEISFADDLKSKGVKASPSYELIPQLSALDNATAISDATYAKGFDALLTIATTELNEEYTYEDALEARGMVRLLGGRPGPGTEAGILISYLSSGTYALHIGLWDAKTQKPVWQVTTHSVFQDSTSDEIKSLADLVVQKLRSKGLI
ncbi:hypothetical protein [Kaarinaea lacus]